MARSWSAVPTPELGYRELESRSVMSADPQERGGARGETVEPKRRYFRRSKQGEVMTEFGKRVVAARDRDIADLKAQLAERDARIRELESQLVTYPHHFIVQQRVENQRLEAQNEAMRGALEEIVRLSNRGDVVERGPLGDIARVALDQAQPPAAAGRQGVGG